MRFILAVAAALWTSLAFGQAVVQAPTTGSPTSCAQFDSNLRKLAATSGACVTAADLALKADLVSPNFTGVPIVPTAGGADDSTQAANTAWVRAYTAAIVQGLNPKAPARVVATSNVVIATALENGDSLSGVTLATGDRVLLTAESAAKDNGLYVVPASGAASRATDMDAAAEFPRATFLILEGTLAGSQWTCNNGTNPVVNTDPITIVQLSNSGTSVSIASQPEAEAGTDNVKAMSPLRNSQALVALPVTATGTSVGATLPTQLSRITAPQNWLAAAGDGSTDTAAAFTSMAAHSSGVHVVPAGSYPSATTPTAPSGPILTLAGNYSLAGTKRPFVSVFDGSQKNLPVVQMFVGQDTTDRSDAINAFFQRNVTDDDGLTNPKNVLATTNVNFASPSQQEYAIAGVCNINATIGNCVGVSGNSFRNANVTGEIFGLHGTVTDTITYAAPTDVQASIGQEVDVIAKGADHPTANSGGGARVIMDLVALSYPFVGGTDGETGMGLRVRTSNAKIRRGITVTDVFKTHSLAIVDTAVYLNNIGSYAIRSVGNNTTAVAAFDGDAPIGLDLNGTYSANAIQLPSNESIGFNGGAGGTVKMFFDGSAELRIASGATEKFGFTIAGTTALQIDGTQVLGPRQTGWTAGTGTPLKGAFAANTATAVQAAQRVLALEQAMRTHGLIN